MRLPLPVLAVLLAALLAGCATSPGAMVGAPTTPAKVVLAIQPTDNADVIQSKAPEMEKFLEERMRAGGVEADVQIIVPLTYAGVVEALRFGHAQAAMMSAWPMAIAAQRADADVVLAEQREVLHDGAPIVAPFYYSHFIVMKDSPYQTLEDLRGKRVAFTSATSTSGYVFPLAKLVETGFVPAPAPGKEADAGAFFGEVVLAGGYAQAWEALKNGRVDVAVMAGDVSATLYGEAMNATRVVATQGPIPSHGVVFAGEFEGPARDALKAAFLEMKGEKRDLMRKLVSGIFVEFKETDTQTHVAGLTGALTTTGIRFGEKLG